MYMRGLSDASEYDEYGDFVPASSEPTAPYTGGSDWASFTPIAQQIVKYTTSSQQSSNGGAPTTNTSSTDWMSLLKQGVATYGNIEASKNVAQPYRAPVRYPTAQPAGYSPFPALTGSGSAPMGKMLLIGLGALILIRRLT